jgi:CubicO group peptidase (beta-lactamase class C family)
MSLWKQAIIIKHLLTMTSGLPWDESSYPYSDSRNDVMRLIGSSDPVQFLLDRAMVSEPGAQWDYNSGGSHLLMEIVNQTTGIDPLEYATERLFDPLGITNLYWGTSSQGIPWGFYDLHLTPLDMAKFGYLYLNNGTWDSTQILTQEWVAESTEPHIMLNGDTGYGYQWWIADQPRGIYDARGMGGQRIMVIPEYDMVVVFVSSGTGAREEDELLHDFILAAVTDAPPIGEFSNTTAYALCLAGLSFMIVVLHRFGRKPNRPPISTCARAYCHRVIGESDRSSQPYSFFGHPFGPV